MKFEAPKVDLPEAPKSAPGPVDELADAMSDLGEALSDKDWAAAATAFRTAHEIAAGGYDDEEDDEE